MAKSNPTLLEKAKKVKSRKQVRNSNAELKELALAWARDEITLTQVCGVLGTSMGSQTYCRLATALKEYIKNEASDKGE